MSWSLMKALFAQFADEIEGVAEYSRWSAKVKEEDPELSKLYQELANVEYDHARKIQMQISKKADIPMEEGEAEKVLRQIWEDRKDEMACDLAEAKAQLDLLK